MLLPLSLSSLVRAADKAAKGEYIAYIGTYTNKQSKGIYAFRFDASTGKLKPLVHRVYDFADLPKAKDAMEGDAHAGKIVVRI